MRLDAAVNVNGYLEFDSSIRGEWVVGGTDAGAVVDVRVGKPALLDIDVSAQVLAAAGLQAGEELVYGIVDEAAVAAASTAVTLASLQFPLPESFPDGLRLVAARQLLSLVGQGSVSGMWVLQYGDSEPPAVLSGPMRIGLRLTSIRLRTLGSASVVQSADIKGDLLFGYLSGDDVDKRHRRDDNDDAATVLADSTLSWRKSTGAWTVTLGGAAASLTLADVLALNVTAGEAVRASLGPRAGDPAALALSALDMRVEAAGVTQMAARVSLGSLFTTTRGLEFPASDLSIDVVPNSGDGEGVVFTNVLFTAQVKFTGLSPPVTVRGAVEFVEGERGAEDSYTLSLAKPSGITARHFYNALGIFAEVDELVRAMVDDNVGWFANVFVLYTRELQSAILSFERSSAAATAVDVITQADVQFFGVGGAYIPITDLVRIPFENLRVFIRVGSPLGGTNLLDREISVGWLMDVTVYPATLEFSCPWNHHIHNTDCTLDLEAIFGADRLSEGAAVALQVVTAGRAWSAALSVYSLLKLFTKSDLLGELSLPNAFKSFLPSLILIRYESSDSFDGGASQASPNG